MLFQEAAEGDQEEEMAENQQLNENSGNGYVQKAPKEVRT